MKDRGIIKWQPFDSLTSSMTMINSILKDKSKINRPILSNDQLNKINDLIIECYYNQITVNIKYYKNNIVNTINGKITKIDKNNKFIYINNQLKLHFSQLLTIST